MVAQARVEGMGFDCTLSMDLDSDENTPPSNAHSSAFSSSSSSSPSNSSTPGTNTSGSSSSSSSSSHSSKVVQPRPKGKFSPKGSPRGSHFVGNTSAKHALAPSNGARAFGKSWIAAPPHARLDQAKMIAAAKALDDDKAEAERKIKDVIEQNRCDRLELDARKVSLEEQEKAIDAMLVKQKAAEQTYEINKAALAVRQTEFDLQHKRLRSTIKSTTASDKTRKDDLDARERKIKAGEKALERTLTSTKAFQQKEGEDFDEAAGCLAGDLKLAHKENEMLRACTKHSGEIPRDAHRKRGRRGWRTRAWQACAALSPETDLVLQVLPIEFQVEAGRKQGERRPRSWKMTPSWLCPLAAEGCSHAHN